MSIEKESQTVGLNNIEMDDLLKENEKLREEMVKMRLEQLEWIGRIRKAKDILQGKALGIQNKTQSYVEALRALGALPSVEEKLLVTEMRDIYLFIQYLKLTGVNPSRVVPEQSISKKEAVEKLAKFRRTSSGAIIQILKRGKKALIQRDIQKGFNDHGWLKGALPPDWPSV